MGGIAVPQRIARRVSRWGTRVCAAALCGTLAMQPLLAQTRAPASSEPGQSAPTRLQIKVLTPVPMLEPSGALSANQVTVQVLDGWGMPVPGAAVSFRLPEAGPGGVFLNGLSTEVAIADREGKAAVQGFDWRAEPGTSFLHVIAAYGEIRAGAMVEVQLGKKVKALPPAATVSSGSRSADPSTVPPAAFPLPEESRAVRTTAAPPDDSNGKENPRRVVIGQSAVESPVGPSASRAAAVPQPAAPAPREMTPVAPPADYQAPNTSEPASYVTVKRKSGGGGKLLLILAVTAAAAGGALAAVVASGGSSSGGGTGPGGSPPADITIGSPSIIVNGGGN